MRALAVIGVVLYHAGVSWLPAGFLGVDTFFVLSGFLITTLLVNEVRHTSTIRLGAFWARRARRLLPALFLVVSFCALFVWIGAAKGTYPGFRLDALSTLLYVANWHFILTGANYFVATSAPSPLTHTWSLAIEEQFYVFWPLILLGLTKLGRGLRSVLVLSVVGAIASAAWMAILLHQGASLTRLYYGTDTHAQCMLVGAALAAALGLLAARRRKAGTVPTGRQMAGRGGDPAWAVVTPALRWAVAVGGFVGLVGGALLWTMASYAGPFLYEGGFFLMALCAGLVLLSVATHQRGTLSRVLSIAPLVFIGRISYGIYLWHYPLFQWLDAQRTGLSGNALLALRLGVTLLVATASFFLIERPIRHGVAVRGWRGGVATLVALLVTLGLVFGATAAQAVPANPTSGFSTSAGSLHDPIRVLLLGDSTALTLGFPLSHPRFTKRYDAIVDDQAAIGCGVVRSSSNIDKGITEATAAACNSSPPPGTMTVQEEWKHYVDTFRPNVVGFLAGRWEVHDLYQNGMLVNIDDKAFQSQVRDGLEEAIKIFTSHGAHVVLFTQPCSDAGTLPNGQPFPEDSLHRLAIYNDIVRQVAAKHPVDVHVFELDRQVCPGNVYHSTIHGLPVRQADGIHFALNAGEFLGPRIWPTLEAVGQQARTEQHAR